MLEAGFARAENHPAWFGGGTAATANGFLLVERSLRLPEFRAAAVRLGLADEAALDEMLAELQSFGKRPDAFGAVLDCSAIGWLEDAPPHA